MEQDNMTVTNAIKTARESIRMIRHGCQWIVVSPNNPDKPNGPVRHSIPKDFFLARESMTAGRASLALSLLGHWSWDAETAAFDTPGSLRERVRAGLKFNSGE
jgi:hypothetical protein